MVRCVQSISQNELISLFDAVAQIESYSNPPCSPASDLYVDVIRLLATRLIADDSDEAIRGGRSSPFSILGAVSERPAQLTTLQNTRFSSPSLLCPMSLFVATLFARCVGHYNHALGIYIPYKFCSIVAVPVSSVPLIQEQLSGLLVLRQELKDALQSFILRMENRDIYLGEVSFAEAHEAELNAILREFGLPALSSQAIKYRRREVMDMHKRLVDMEKLKAWLSDVLRIAPETVFSPADEEILRFNDQISLRINREKTVVAISELFESVFRRVGDMSAAMHLVNHHTFVCVRDARTQTAFDVMATDAFAAEPPSSLADVSSCLSRVVAAAQSLMIRDPPLSYTAFARSFPSLFTAGATFAVADAELSLSWARSNSPPPPPKAPQQPQPFYTPGEVSRALEALRNVYRIDTVGKFFDRVGLRTDTSFDVANVNTLVGGTQHVVEVGLQIADNFPHIAILTDSLFELFKNIEGHDALPELVNFMRSVRVGDLLPVVREQVQGSPFSEGVLANVELASRALSPLCLPPSQSTSCADILRSMSIEVVPATVVGLSRAVADCCSNLAHVKQLFLSFHSFSPEKVVFQLKQLRANAKFFLSATGELSVKMEGDRELNPEQFDELWRGAMLCRDEMDQSGDGAVVLNFCRSVASALLIADVWLGLRAAGHPLYLASSFSLSVVDDIVGLDSLLSRLRVEEASWRAALERAEERFPRLLLLPRGTIAQAISKCTLSGLTAAEVAALVALGFPERPPPVESKALPAQPMESALSSIGSALFDTIVDAQVSYSGCDCSVHVLDCTTMTPAELRLHLLSIPELYFCHPSLTLEASVLVSPHELRRFLRCAEKFPDFSFAIVKPNKLSPSSLFALREYVASAATSWRRGSTSGGTLYLLFSDASLIDAFRAGPPDPNSPLEASVTEVMRAALLQRGLADGICVWSSSAGDGKSMFIHGRAAAAAVSFRSVVPIHEGFVASLFFEGLPLQANTVFFHLPIYTEDEGVLAAVDVALCNLLFHRLLVDSQGNAFVRPTLRAHVAVELPHGLKSSASFFAHIFASINASSRFELRNDAVAQRVSQFLNGNRIAVREDPLADIRAKMRPHRPTGSSSLREQYIFLRAMTKRMKYAKSAAMKEDELALFFAFECAALTDSSLTAERDSSRRMLFSHCFKVLVDSSSQRMVELLSFNDKCQLSPTSFVLDIRDRGDFSTFSQCIGLDQPSTLDAALGRFVLTNDLAFKLLVLHQRRKMHVATILSGHTGVGKVNCLFPC